MPGEKHLGEELAENPARVHVHTRFGTVVGGRATNGAAVFLGKCRRCWLF
jgi:hypothetical protein